MIKILNHLVWNEVDELGQVRPRLVRATGDGGVCAAMAKSSWSVAKHKGIHRLITVPL